MYKESNPNNEIEYSNVEELNLSNIEKSLRDISYYLSCISKNTEFIANKNEDKTLFERLKELKEMHEVSIWCFLFITDVLNLLDSSKLIEPLKIYLISKFPFLQKFLSG